MIINGKETNQIKSNQLENREHEGEDKRRDIDAVSKVQYFSYNIVSDKASMSRVE